MWKSFKNILNSSNRLDIIYQKTIYSFIPSLFILILKLLRKKIYFQQKINTHMFDVENVVEIVQKYF